MVLSVNFWDKNLIFGIWFPYIQRQLDLSRRVTRMNFAFFGDTLLYNTATFTLHKICYHVCHFLTIKFDKEVSFTFSWSVIGPDFKKSAILPINQIGSPGPCSRTLLRTLRTSFSHWILLHRLRFKKQTRYFHSPMDCLHARPRIEIFPCLKYALSSSPHFSDQTLFDFNHFSYSFLLCLMGRLKGFSGSHISTFRSKWKVLRSRDHGPFKLLRRGLAENRHPDYRRPQPCASSPRPPFCGLVCVWSKCKCKDVTM